MEKFGIFLGSFLDLSGKFLGSFWDLSIAENAGFYWGNAVDQA